MQQIKIYVVANDTLAKVTDYASAQTVPVQSLIFGVAAQLK